METKNNYLPVIIQKDHNEDKDIFKNLKEKSAIIYIDDANFGSEEFTKRLFPSLEEQTTKKTEKWRKIFEEMSNEDENAAYSGEALPIHRVRHSFPSPFTKPKLIISSNGNK